MTDPLKTFDTASPSKSSNSPSVSQKKYPIAGILTTVFGLDEIPSHASEIACLWLLHPRLATQERMTGFATAVIADWNHRIKDGRAGPIKGLIAVSFDQRNHGTRLVDPLANEAWREGNPRHAQDMFSIFQGTARDVSLLMDYLPAYVFPQGERTISKHMVLGVSLGGHAAWSCLLHEPRVSAGVVIIGCPDYVNLMRPPGSRILGSEAFPSSLLETISKLDPASIFLRYVNPNSDAGPLRNHPLPEPTENEKQALLPVLRRCLAGKKILNLSGGADKLVPYHRGEVFLTWLKKAIAPDGWFADGAVTFEDIIDEKAGHEVTPKMVDEAVRFISETLASSDEAQKSSYVRESKI
ncbi:uncharacterized protein P174DRAFT_491878 [Aspergillus novofumigatus IBT 16806]|uniref:Alpha/beta-hydrolase n=1 Tax=Aspergillus novofumigatus (strain IBT 16806) TaxID=1392255 RepID=A0A2I1C1V7_ASPN1|nr:uncharacterized protein P174DRAFT_491878 [Aspergillus novofumigatus IBT 16806]PKX91585.1 hypothetical protein P174DRAFT_491878 [Aspergillus novofumigatus IBT 16806]